MPQPNELWGQIHWPLKAILPVNLDGNKAEIPQVVDSTGLLILCKCTNAQETKQLVDLLNWMNSSNEMQEATISELRIRNTELEEVKKKYYELLKSIESQRQAAQNGAQQDGKKDPSPAQQMVAMTGTEDIAEDREYRR